MKKNMYHILQWRILKSTFSRFISILLIIFIGTAFFAGLRITPLVMNVSTTEYLKKQEFADITYFSTYGITPSEMKEIENIDGVTSVQGGYHFDALGAIDKEQIGVTVYSFNTETKANQPYITKGRMPKENNECLIDETFVKNNEDVKIGGTITLETKDRKKEFTIVGFSKDVRYLLMYDRGTNTYGDGNTAAFIQIKEEAAKELSYNEELYTVIGDTPIYQEVLITIDKSSFVSIFTEEYKDTLDVIETDIKEQIYPLINKRFEMIIDDKMALLPEGMVEARKQIEAIPKPFNIVLDYTLNQGLASFQSDSDRIDAIARVFPSIFFLVAALVSLTTMTRMVEEQRSQNGTMRALGYTKKDIIFQYLLYALLATLLGTILGILFGIRIFPAIIYGLYSTMMYDIPQTMSVCSDTVLFLQTGGIAIITILLATLAACLKELNVLPASLMRTKAPKMGKRLVLERITWLWKRLSFNQKITFRNIFRYKKRFFMSIIGIAGCTALLITGFGIRYSVVDMASRQFDDIQIFDASVTFKTAIPEEKIDATILDTPLIKEQIGAYETTITVKQNKKSIDSIFIVPNSTKQITKFVNLMDYKTSDPLTINNEGIIISQKAAEVLDVTINDTLSLSLNNQEFDVTITNITQNYLQHYIYMSPTLYQSLTNENVTYNSMYINMRDVTDTNKEVLGQDIMKEENVAGIVFTSTIAENFATQMNSIDLVVWVLIISAGFLAFIVLYNLTNINIKERTNEIATIKVLGFYPKEVYDYIFRENKLLTIIGALVGCILGIVLHRFILQTVEMDFLMFVRSIRPISFVYSILITYGFTLVINFIMRSLLRRIDMIASLKQVE